MEWFELHFLTVLTFLPAVLGGIGFFLPKDSKFLHRVWALCSSLIVFVLSVRLLAGFEVGSAAMQRNEYLAWIPSLGVAYSMGVDGISLWLVMLTTFLMPILILGSFSAVETKDREFFSLLLMLESAMLGAFFALDMFLFYLFWEAMLIPMYFLIGVWGGKDRIFASMKFFLYTIFGSLLMLVAIFYLSHQHSVQFGTYSTVLMDLSKVHLSGDGWLSPQSLLFAAFALAFAIKVPLFPLHTWLPDAHVQAPTAGSVVLAGVLLKMGGYGFIRFALPLFPAAAHLYQPVFLALGSIAIVYGAWVAMIQPDIKKLVAYSSVSHMGYVIVGLFSFNSAGVTGAVYQMLNHGISTGALFLLVGMLYERRHTREIDQFGGLTRPMPLYAAAFLITTLSSVALPGTNGFVGEFLILLGAWQADRWVAVVSATGVVFGAVYMLWMYRRVLFGPLSNPENEKLLDLNLREKFVLAPLLVAMFVMGLMPNLFFSRMDSSIQQFLKQIQIDSPKAYAMQGSAVIGGSNE